jgi:NAD(P)-dependent dehydrogenase (short-subunit alcohol dehydrogenase family)
METALITGCSSGIGAATARAFLEEDWTVYATARDVDDLADLADAGCETAELDVTDGDQIHAVVDRVVDETGRIDCLVNNAGYATYAPVEDLPLRDLHRQFDVNLYGPHRLIRAVLPHMREREAGTIINLSSVNGRIAHPLGGAYSGSKHALEAMSDALRVEVAEFGVDVVLIEPGPVDTNFDERADAEAVPEEERTQAYDSLYRAFDDASTAIGGGGGAAVDPENVAAAILDAASCTEPAARYPVGSFARVALLGRFLPDRIRDTAYRFVTKVAR